MEQIGGLTLPRLHPHPQVGRFYPMGALMGRFTGTLESPVEVIKDRIFTRAFPWSYDVPLASLSVATANGHTAFTAKALMAIYADNNGAPGSKLLTATELTLAAINSAYTATVSWKPPPGIYWISLTLSHGQPDGCLLLCECELDGPANAVGMPLGAATANFPVFSTHGVATRVYDSTIPDPHPAMTIVTTNHLLPRIMFGF